MLLVLLASVGAAWLIVRASPGSRGADVLHEIRANGLDAYWHGPGEHWMVHYTRAGVPIGWRAAFRNVDKGAGGYVGLDVIAEYGQSGLPEVFWELWRVNRDATECDYRAGSLRARRTRLAPAMQWTLSADTRISLSGGQLSVSQDQGPIRVDTRAPAPDNYIPEGLVPLTYFLTGRQNVRGNYQLIFNSSLPPAGSTQPPLHGQEVRPLDPRDPAAGAAGAVVGSDVLLPGPRGPVRTHTYLFDKTGKTLAVVEYGGKDGDKDRKIGQRLAVDRAEANERFPDASRRVRDLVRLLAAARIGTFALPSHLARPADAPETEPAPPEDPTGAPE